CTICVKRMRYLINVSVCLFAIYRPYQTGGSLMLTVNTGKWIIAQSPEQYSKLHQIRDHATALGAPVSWLSPEEACEMEPALSTAFPVLHSPNSGIVDSHALMLHLHGEFTNAGGDVAFNTRVVALER